MAIQAFATKEEWLAARKSFVGGSEQSALLAADKDGGPLAVYHRKVGTLSEDELPVLRDSDPEEETADMQRGHFLESGIARWWAHNNGLTLLEPWEVTGNARGSIIVLRHPEQPEVAATPDFFARTDDDELYIVQVKAPRFEMRRKWESGVPLKYQVQTNSEGSLALANGIPVHGSFQLVRSSGDDPPVDYDVPHDPELFSLVCRKVAEFWEMHVVRGVPPPPNPFADTLDDIKRRYKGVIEGQRVTLDGELVRAWLAAKEQKKLGEQALKTLQPQLLCAMGKAQFGEVDGVAVVRRRTVNGFPVPARFQESYDVLEQTKAAAVLA